MSIFDPFNINNLDSNSINDDTEFFPLLSSEDEEIMNSEEMPEVLSILPLRNTVLFPGVVIPITVGRDKSIKLIKDAYKGNKIIGVVAQKDANIEDPTFEDLYKVGTVAYIVKMLQMPDGNTTVIIQGKRKFHLKELIQENPYIKANVENFEESTYAKNKEFEALVASLKELAIQIIQISPNIPSEAAFAIKNIESPSFLINFISSNMNAELVDKQKMLEQLNLVVRGEMVLEHLTKELQMLELKNQIQSKVRVDIDRQQREYFLHQQMKQIQEELGGDAPDLEIKNLRERGEKKLWNKEVADAFNKELDKLQRMNPAAAEYSVLLNYAELLLELPWNEFTEDLFDIKKAQKILDQDHFGLEKVKSRILEYLAVLKLKHNIVNFWLEL